MPQSTTTTNLGKVSLVGAGPGDPGLLTIRGLECLRAARTVVYDFLVNPALLDHAVNADEFICVGKRAGSHTLPQDEINALLVAKSRQGRITARLKGGDPFVFGRGGEEALALAAAGCPFEVVPGVTAAVAATAYAGIPVTHRDCNSVLTLVTGHENPDKPESALDWVALARGGGTLVFYMGLRHLPGIVERLLAHGRPATTPAAVIASGTLPGQQVVTGTLADIDERAQQAAIAPPALIVVGEVVALREHLRWFELRPLFGRTIVVTRTRRQASELARMLEEQGARVVSLPTIRIAAPPPPEARALRAALSDLGAFDWTLFTSVNTVEHVFLALAAAGGDSRRFAACRVAAVGDATAAALRSQGIVPDLVAERATSEALYAALHEAGEIAGKRMLLPRSDLAPERLPERLRQAGAAVTAVTAYRTLPAEPDTAALAALLETGVDLITFTSSSTVHQFAAMVRARHATWPAAMLGASIGPETTAAARVAGLEIAVEAQTQTIPGLVRAIVDHFNHATPNAQCSMPPRTRGPEQARNAAQEPPGP